MYLRCWSNVNVRIYKWMIIIMIIIDIIIIIIIIIKKIFFWAPSTTFLGALNIEGEYNWGWQMAAC